MSRKFVEQHSIITCERCNTSMRYDGSEDAPNRDYRDDHGGLFHVIRLDKARDFCVSCYKQILAFATRHPAVKP